MAAATDDDRPAVLPDTAIIETWNSIEEKCIKLADIITEDIIKTGQDFDVAIVISRGGFGPANIILRRLGFESTAIYCVSLSSYEDVEITSDHRLSLGQMPGPKELARKHLLVIDEVCESGYSLDLLTQLLKRAGVKSCKTGVIHYKPKTAQRESGFAPTWYVEQTEEWVHYPWESHDPAGREFKLRKKIAGLKPAKRPAGQVVTANAQKVKVGVKGV